MTTARMIVAQTPSGRIIQEWPWPSVFNRPLSQVSGGLTVVVPGWPGKAVPVIATCCATPRSEPQRPSVTMNGESKRAADIAKPRPQR